MKSRSERSATLEYLRLEVTGWNKLQAMVKDEFVARVLEEWEKDELQLNFFAGNTINKRSWEWITSPLREYYSRSGDVFHPQLRILGLGTKLPDLCLNENKFMLVLYEHIQGQQIYTWNVPRDFDPCGFMFIPYNANCYIF